jgi:hypothetical protein
MFFTCPFSGRLSQDNTVKGSILRNRRSLKPHTMNPMAVLGQGMLLTLFYIATKKKMSSCKY